MRVGFDKTGAEIDIQASDSYTPGDDVSFAGPFNLVINSDTTLVDLSDPLPFFRLYNASGVFTQGSFSATLTGIILVASADPALALINLFNSSVDDGLGFHNPALTGYQLLTSIGPISGSGVDLTPTFNGGFFAATGVATRLFPGRPRSDVPGQSCGLRCAGTGHLRTGESRSHRTSAATPHDELDHI